MTAADITTGLAHTLDPVRFVRECLNFHPDEPQTRFLQAAGHRVILNCTRQWGKSTLCAAAAVHRAFASPGALIVVASPTERQSGEFIRKAAEFVRNLEIKPRGDGYNEVSILLPNGSRIVGLPGSHRTIRGFSALSLLILDEAALVPDELYLALRPMLAVSRGDLWMLSTPYGKRGFFYRVWTDGGPHWNRIRVPATECPRISHEFLAEERAESSPEYFNQEYMCQFHATQDALFDEDTVRRRLDPGIAPLFPNGAP
ncbi:MAG TPA: terminase family protein [Bryobacteraceae bacterium]|nr:terminase family protein [Bryobacteraceae bacterium]